MDARTDEARSEEQALAATIVVAPPRASVTNTAPSAPAVEVVQGSGPHLSAETQSLLRSRLCAAAVILVLASALFYARNVLGQFVGWAQFPVSDPVMIFLA